MTFNPYARLRGVTPGDRLLIGTVAAVDGTRVRVELPDGGVLTAIGSAEIGQRVYVQGGVIQGPAPDLPILEIEI